MATPILDYLKTWDGKAQEPKPQELKSQDSEAKDENAEKKDLESEERLDSRMSVVVTVGATSGKSYH